MAPGQRGRPRKSVQQHLLEGTFRPRRHDNITEPNATGEPIKPDWLDADGEWVWNLVVKGWMKEMDSAELEQLCVHWSLWKKASVIAMQDPMDKDNRQAVNQYLQSFVKLGVKFGLSPLDRAAIMVGKEHAVKESDFKDDKKDPGRFFNTVG